MTTSDTDLLAVVRLTLNNILALIEVNEVAPAYSRLRDLVNHLDTLTPNNGPRA